MAASWSSVGSDKLVILLLFIDKSPVAELISYKGVVVSYLFNKLSSTYPLFTNYFLSIMGISVSWEID